MGVVSCIILILTLLSLSPLPPAGLDAGGSTPLQYPAVAEGEAAASVGVIPILGAWGVEEVRFSVEPSGSVFLDNLAVEGVLWWSRSIGVFTALYGYNYLNRLSIKVGLNLEDADVTIRYVSSLGDERCGVTNYLFNPVNNMILEAEITVSRECIDLYGLEVASVVVAHEVGHALGLGHTSYYQDLMYSYVVPEARPSTLDLVGLAEAYRWLKDGFFKTPPHSAALPSGIPFQYLLDEGGNPIVIAVTIIRVVGGYSTELERITINPGEEITLEAEEIIELTERERLRFVGWFLDGMMVSSSTSFTIKPRENLVLIQRYVKQYWINITTAYAGDVVGWFDEGEELEVSVPEIINLSNVTRLRFAGWEGLNITAPSFTLYVNDTLTAQAVWILQFNIRVTSPAGEVAKEIWADAGSQVNITLEERVINLGNGTRLLLTGFKIGDEILNGSSVRVVATRPLAAESLWRVQYLVKLLYEPLRVVNYTWVSKDENVTLEASEIINLGNMTRLKLRGWAVGELEHPGARLVLMVDKPLNVTVFYDVEYLVRVLSEYEVGVGDVWVRRGVSLVLEAPKEVMLSNVSKAVFLRWSGDAESPARRISVVVTKPLELVMEWRLEHVVRVLYPRPLDDKVMWVPEGGVVSVEAPEVVQLTGYRRLEFVGWSRGLGDENIAEIVVTGPVVVEAVYREAFLVTLVFRPDVGVTVLAEGPSGQVRELRSGLQTWLEKGRWVVLEAVFRGVDVGRGREFTVDGAEAEVTLDVKNVTVVVKDALGIPAPAVVAEFIRPSDNVVEYSTASNIAGEISNILVTGYVSKVRLYGLFPAVEAGLDGEDERIEVTIPLSYYTLALITPTALAALKIMTKFRRRNHVQGLMYY